MQPVDLADYLMDALSVVMKKYVPEADHEALMVDVVATLDNNNCDLDSLYGFYEELDDALDEYRGRGEEELDDYDD